MGKQLNPFIGPIEIHDSFPGQSEREIEAADPGSWSLKERLEPYEGLEEL